MNAPRALRPLVAVLLLGGLPACGRSVVGFPLNLNRVDDTGQETGQPDRNRAPYVTETTPTPGASGVEPDAAVTATFSEDVDPATLHAESFLLLDGQTALEGQITWSAPYHRVTFEPTQPLALGGAFSATLTTAVQDRAGRPMAASWTWIFTTVPTAQMTIPPG